jgi:hypothetical protein
MASRHQYPESWLWETEEGRQWLIRLVVAVLYHFGLKRGVGAETMSAFFASLHLEHHVGSSPSTLRAMMDKLETLVLETTAAWEREGIASAQMGPMVGAVDETFLQRMMLVFMDLVSGYIFLEETTEDRSYETWYAHVRTRLEPMQSHVLYLVSDRAKALIKLAHTGLTCLSIPDLFHLLHDLAKGYSLSIFTPKSFTPSVIRLIRCSILIIFSSVEGSSWSDGFIESEAYCPYVQYSRFFYRISLHSPCHH